MHLYIFSVSYTMDDLVFDWEMENALVLDNSIELPQHNLISTNLDHCHNIYSTGMCSTRCVHRMCVYNTNWMKILMKNW